MPSAEELLSRTFRAGMPAVLFLGQEWAAGSAGGNTVLHVLLQRKTWPSDVPGTWKGVLASGLTDEDLEWLTERFERTVASSATELALNLPWSAVFTTSVDPTLLRRLETRGRQPEPITSADHFPAVPRSTARPPTYYLFGRSSESQEVLRPPRTSLELVRRLARHTSVLLARIPETVTPLGLLVVDGYRSSRDWLPVESLLGALPVNEGMKVLWLGPDETVQASPLFQELVAKGCVISDPRVLGEIAVEMEARGELRGAELPVLHESGVITLEGDSFVELAPALRLRVEASAAIVDDEWTRPPAPLSRAAEEDLFARVHGDPGSARLLVEGVARKFFVRREFEETLWRSVSGALGAPTERARIILVHGQSGTGKTVALARLALVGRLEGRAPVLMAGNRIPEAADVEAFCEEMDRVESRPTLLLCDANLAPERYFALADALRSRGRRFVFVATSYRHENLTRYRGLDVVEAPDQVTAQERLELASVISPFLNDDSRAMALREEHVFALLYRALSAGRPRLASGVSREAWYAENVLRGRAAQPRAPSQLTNLGRKLVAAGLHSGEQVLFEIVDEAASGKDAPGRLIDYVMSAGRVDTAIPVNLLLRALRARDTSLGYDAIAELFGNLDLFRWRYADEEQADLLVGPRLQIEAELVCRRRLAGSGRELECLVDLIEAVRPRGVERDAEMRFLLDLLQKLDADGPRGSAYAPGYLRIAGALTNVRRKHGVEDASLMLQESNFRRAWLREVDSGRRDTPPGQRDSVLDEARAVVEEAITKIESRELRAGRKTRENLYVERASIYGFLAVGHAKSGVPIGVVWSDYLAARVATRRAMSTAAKSYFPFDVALWTSADLLEETVGLSLDRRGELQADIYSVLDLIDPRDLAISQLEKYHARRQKVGTIIGDRGLAAAALVELERVNPAAAAFLSARGACPEVLEQDALEFGAEVRDKARGAAAFLRERRDAIAADVRCLRLLLEFDWAAETGQRLLRSNRGATPFGVAARERLLSVARDLRAASGGLPEPQMTYLEAVLLWLLGAERDAEQAWRGLARETEFEDRRRVLRRLLVTDRDGVPTRHRGRIVEHRSEGKWVLEVEGVRGRVDVLERDFRGQVFRLGNEVRDFWIAFNYLGPIADPPGRREVEP